MSKKYEDESLSQKVIACIIAVHKTLGPGFLENIYRNALMLELTSQSLVAESEKEITIYYRGCEVGIHRLDILVENSLILELKTVDALCKPHYAQIRSYMKAADIRVGILVNFAGELADFRRVDR